MLCIPLGHAGGLGSVQWPFLLAFARSIPLVRIVPCTSLIYIARVTSLYFLCIHASLRQVGPTKQNVRDKWVIP